MQEDIDDIALQCDLLALNAMIESARGDDGQRFQQQAEKLRSLARGLISDNKISGAADKAANLLQEFESRLETLSRWQSEISEFAAEIAHNSRSATRALQFEDVVSKVVVYSNAHANCLRSSAALIEARNAVIANGIAASQNEITSMTAAFRSQLEALSADRQESPICPASQNSLDHVDSEMF